MASINGTSGNDNLTGTPGNDLIFGDFGDDILNGGGGEDKFVFNNINNVLHIDSDMYVYSTDGLDIIKNFSGMIINSVPVNHSYEHVIEPLPVTSNDGNPVISLNDDNPLISSNTSPIALISPVQPTCIRW